MCKTKGLALEKRRKMRLTYLESKRDEMLARVKRSGFPQIPATAQVYCELIYMAKTLPAKIFKTDKPEIDPIRHAAWRARQKLIAKYRVMTGKGSAINYPLAESTIGDDFIDNVGFKIKRDL